MHFLIIHILSKSVFVVCCVNSDPNMITDLRPFQVNVFECICFDDKLIYFGLIENGRQHKQYKIQCKIFWIDYSQTNFQRLQIALANAEYFNNSALLHAKMVWHIFEIQIDMQEVHVTFSEMILFSDWFEL